MHGCLFMHEKQNYHSKILSIVEQSSKWERETIGIYLKKASTFNHHILYIIPFSKCLNTATKLIILESGQFRTKGDGPVYLYLYLFVRFDVFCIKAACSCHGETIEPLPTMSVI